MLRMELRHLEYFIAVAAELNFSRAAQRIHVVQSALSASVAASAGPALRAFSRMLISFPVPWGRSCRNVRGGRSGGRRSDGAG